MIRRLFLSTLITLLTSFSVLAQRTVTGTISGNDSLPLPSSNDSFPLPGASVVVKGTDRGTSTDFDGNYTIEVSDDNAILVVSYIGFITQEILVGDQTIINITLSEDPESLSEVVMTGYGSGSQDNYATVRIFFASDRNLTDSKEPNERFGAKRSNDVRYGTCEVSIPREHHMGELEEASIWKFEFRNDPEKHVTLLDVTVESKIQFFSELTKTINTSPEKNAFIFVHGYNVSFEDAARRTAQMSYDLGFTGAPVFYSWPSQDTLFGYNIDEGNIEWSEGNLKVFLEDFLTQSNAQNIYLIGHSMGNRGLTRALVSIINEDPTMARRIKEIILAAPDIDADVFRRDIAPVLIQGNKPITLYTSSEDIPLIASQTFSNYPRAGQSGDDMVILSGIETIDASNVKSDFLGHSYFGESTNILSDIYYIIHKGQRPNERFALQKVVSQGRTYWEFKE